MTTDLVGTWSETLSLQGSLRVDDQWSELDLGITVAEEELVVDGTVQSSMGWVELHELLLHTENLFGRCPRATGGHAHVWGEEDAVSVEPAPDGKVKLTWGDKESVPSDPCELL